VLPYKGQKKGCNHNFLVTIFFLRAVMNYYFMTDKAIMAEIGVRLKGLRLRRNRTQQQLADSTDLSLNVIKGLEAGRGKLSSLIAVLRELDGLDALDLFIREEQISPLQLAKQQGKKRQRATGSRRKKDEGQAEW
jgi:putative transcriptional regulator